MSDSHRKKNIVWNKGTWTLFRENYDNQTSINFIERGMPMRGVGKVGGRSVKF